MALTATATPVPAPAWDEQIVPALRKRLEAESRMLTKRMSMISTHSGDDWEGSPPSRSIPDFTQSASASSYADERRRQQTYQESRLEQARASPVASRPSAIPRPSLQYSRRDNDDQPSPSPTTQRQQRPKRTRTQSTPGLHNLPTPASSRSNSPMVAMNAKPSRIPTKASPASPAVPRMPTNGAVRKASNTTAFPPSPETSPDLFLIPAATRTKASLVAAANSSRSSFEYPPTSPSMRTEQSTEIIREPPPFASYEPGRLSFSNDEGERPFEHWYRGESRRNGGVGEVKIATQNDMLTIATYGHKLGSSPSSASGFGSVGQGGGRRRAGTISHRESWFMDDDALRAMHPMPGSTTVMDEQPLTDIETSNLSEFDVSSPNSQAATPRYPPMDLPSQISHKQSFQQHQQEQSDAWAQLDLELDRRPSNMSLAASQHQQQQQQQPSRGASRQEVRPQASNASLHVNTVVANNNVSANGSRRSPMSPAQQVAAAASSQRGRSPRTQPPRRGQQKPRSKSQPGLGNTSTGSAGTGDELVEYEMDAIPVWTQPKHNGNWDDVVLPAVAKKMGMVDNVNYEQTDGTPRPPRKRESSDRIAPAPGTFGYDESKVRRPPPTLQLDEFGRPGEPGPQTSGESEEERQQTEPILRPISPGTMRRGRSTAEPPPSPAPFSSYNTPQRPLQPPRMNSQPSIQYQMQPQVYIEPPPPERFVLEKQKEEKEESGCCRCVIM